MVAANLQGFERPNDAVGIFGHQARQEVDDPLASWRVDPAEHPVIERGDHAAFEDPHTLTVEGASGSALRDEHDNAGARQAISKSLELNPNRVWAKQQLEKTPAK